MRSCLTKEKKISKKKTVCTTKTKDDAAYPEKRRFLYLMRHAKASKEYETYAERDRPLIKRGKKDAKIMKKFISYV